LPVRINSGYRCPLLNEAVGSKSTSQHLKGEAADIEIGGVPNTLLAQWIDENLTFDQLILEFVEPDDPYSGWVHVSTTEDINRQMTLTINSTGTKRGLDL